MFIPPRQSPPPWRQLPPHLSSPIHSHHLLPSPTPPPQHSPHITSSVCLQPPRHGLFATAAAVQIPCPLGCTGTHKTAPPSASTSPTTTELTPPRSPTTAGGGDGGGGGGGDGGLEVELSGDDRGGGVIDAAAVLGCSATFPHSAGMTYDIFERFDLVDPLVDETQ